MVKIELTEQEANVLLQMIDVAVKALGLNGAEAGVVLAKKLKDAGEAASKPAAEPQADAA